MEDKNLHSKIEETLSSIDGIQRAELNQPEMYHKIIARLESKRRTQANVIPLYRVRLAAAVFIGIIVLNISSMFFFKNTQEGRNERQPTEQSEFAQFYFSDSSLKY